MKTKMELLWRNLMADELKENLAQFQKIQE